MRYGAALLTIVCSVALAGEAALAQDFTYSPPGQLESGTSGRVDDTVYVPGMRYPIENAPSYPNSQVYGAGGSQGPGGGQCDASNYSYPWHDNFCEPRQWTMPLCPSGTGHQGQDIRAATCDNRTHWAVAAEDGQITSIGTFSVNLMSDSGTRHRYLHMDPGSLTVREGDAVAKGDRLGLVSNAFGGTPTTIHLHYDLQQNVSGMGTIYVPTYMSLVRSYEVLLGEPAAMCDPLPAEGGTIDDGGPCHRLFGPGQYWRRVNDDGFGGSLSWTNAFDGENASNWSQWRVILAEAGQYKVDAFITDAYAASQRARYGVRHAGQESEVTHDISSADGWFEIGTYDFAAGEDQWVAVYDNTGETESERRIPADAIRFTRLDLDPNNNNMVDAGTPDVADPPDTNDPPDTDDPEDTGGNVEPDVVVDNNGDDNNTGGNNTTGNNGGVVNNAMGGGDDNNASGGGMINDNNAGDTTGGTTPPPPPVVKEGCSVATPSHRDLGGASGGLLAAALGALVLLRRRRR